MLKNLTKQKKAHTIKLITQRRGYNPQVLIKITGVDQNLNQLKSHIKYISRDGLLDFFINYSFDTDNERYLDEIAVIFKDGIYDIPTKSEIEKHNLKEKNEMLHMVFQ